MAMTEHSSPSSRSFLHSSSPSSSLLQPPAAAPVAIIRGTAPPASPASSSSTPFSFSFSSQLTPSLSSSSSFQFNINTNATSIITPKNRMSSPTSPGISDSPIPIFFNQSKISMSNNSKKRSFRDMAEGDEEDQYGRINAYDEDSDFELIV
ncbi:hypothetical protein DASC09_019250 [Saccharomycopsis crataegensis]|uniref:Uncharacterized protein n=1 Tax=Saccharomycopsis crataegensis TaxID=43959 RepID=A0AAV5QI36_9ASCO|nr:hypothetical protein DASC09_019250 [Saccharomycopsis crataegensis]